MGLLTISEPSSANKNKKNKQAIGIDLGTTHSLVASHLQNKPTILPDQSGRYLLPSIVYYGADRPIVGCDAEPYLLTDPEQTIVSVKRFMGRREQSSRAQKIEEQLKLYHFHLDPKHGMPVFVLQDKQVTPIEVSADILQTLKKRAEFILQDDIVEAVITVPAYFDNAQRQATKIAAKQAGLTVLRLLNEPTAAAVAYGIDRLNQNQCIAVYDLGGGTFDLSILQLSQGVFKVLATSGDTALGGDDLDTALAIWILDQQSLTLATLTRTEQRAILVQARSIKESLTEQSRAIAHWKEWTGEITQSVLDMISKPFIQKTLQITHQALQDSGQMLTDIDQVILVGGATRMPCVRKQVTDYFQQIPHSRIDPEQVVALGAAIQANMLVGHVPPEEAVLLLDVLPLSLGLETMGGLMEKIIPRNTTLPIHIKQSFTTYKNGQNGMKFHVLQGERELVADNHSLAIFHLTGIPPMTAGLARVEVTFQVDADGLLSVTASEMTTGIQASIEVKPLYGMDQSDIMNQLKASYEHAESDKKQREFREKQIESKQLIMALHQAFSEQEIEKEKDPESQDLYAALAALEKALACAELCEQLNEYFNRLNILADAYFSKKANQNLKSCLAGRSIDGIERISND